MRTSIRVILLLGLAGLFCGCAATSTPAPGEPSSSLVSPASPGITSPPVAPLSGVVATGSLTTTRVVPGSVTGTVQISAYPATSSFGVQLDGFVSSVSGQLNVELSSTAIQPGETCQPDGTTYDLDSAADTPSQSFFLPGRGPLAQNPSFYTDLILVQTVYPFVNGCGGQLVAYAPLRWNIGDLRPQLHVADSGPRIGAEGQPTTAAGLPVSYTVISGDTLKAIAARFGITIDDLFYLNPTRSPNPESPHAIPGEVLNLSKPGR
jgi:hypothetical protein